METVRNKGLMAALKGSIAFLALSSGIAPVIAQQADADEDIWLETIVVTAAKREQTLQEVPIAVSVVRGDEIQKAEIQDILDLQSLVPSLEVRQSSSTANAGFVIRGFGGVASNAGIEPSVGVFIDGVYRSRASAQISDLLNIGRVEVLRGPQSTLFGKNASVGVVSIVTQAPEFDFGGTVSATYGNFDTVRLRGNITGPITDELAFRLAASYNRRDGYAENLETGGGLNDRNRWGVQGQLLYRPSDDFQIRIIGDYDEIDESCCLTANIVSGPVTDAIVGALGSFVDEDPFSYEGFANFDPTNQVDNAGISVHIDKGFGSAKLTSITAYRTVDSFSFSDADATSADIVTSLNEGDVETFTQEIRIASDYDDGPVDWLVGGFFFDEKIEQPGEFLYGADFRPFVNGISGNALTLVEAALGLPIGTTFGQQGQGPIEERGQDNTSWSIFANIDWRITDALTATFGGSYIKDEKEAFLSQVNTDSFSALDFVAIGFGQALAGVGVNPGDPAAVAAFAAANPTAFAAIQAGAQNPATNPLLALRGLQFNPPFLDFPNSVEDGRSNDDKFTYNFRLAYDVSDSVNIYGSFATGFKATSFNLSRNSRPSPADFTPGSPVTNPPSSPIRDAGLDVPNLTTGTRFAGPEETEVLEFGLKVLRDNLYFNLTVFDQTIKGFQSNIFTGVGFALSNAGEQSTRGIEVDTQWAVTDQLTLSFFGAFYDAEFDSFEDSPNGDLTGRRPAGIPEVSTNTAVNYDFQIGDLDAFVRADWQYSGPTAYTDDPNFQNLIGFEREFNLVNASAGITFENGTSLTVWGRNIFGEDYITGAFPAIAQSGSVSGFPNQPATYGLTLRHRF